MPRSIFFRAVGPIGDTDTDALPVKEIGPAVGYYTQCLGFTLVSQGETTAVLRRDDVQIGLAANGRDPEQASCWFSVGDVDALWREYEAKGIAPGIISGNRRRSHGAGQPLQDGRLAGPVLPHQKCHRRVEHERRFGQGRDGRDGEGVAIRLWLCRDWRQ